LQIFALEISLIGPLGHYIYAELYQKIDVLSHYLLTYSMQRSPS